MTKFVTATNALVLSPVDSPAEPAGLPDVFDAFARFVVAVEEDQLAGRWEAGYAILGHRSAPELMFRAVPLLRDGSTMPHYVPESWRGRVTRALVADYFQADWLLYLRKPSWGAHLPFVEVMTVEDRLLTRSVLPAKLPLVDPLRDAARTDDEETLPLRPELEGGWAGFLTPWEHVDGYLTLAQPGEAWLARRSARATVPIGRVWWELTGLRDAGDAERYRGQWPDPMSVSLYLGWPAYFTAAAGATTRCPACRRVTIQGRRYCGAPECNRARAAARQRESRAAARRS